MEDHAKRLLNQHSRQHKQLSCTWNANMKWSTGQSGLIRTLRQVIKSTVASMNARQRQQTPQITVHMNDNHTKNKFTSCKFQVSQTNCFTFPKQQNSNSLQIPENSCKLPCAKLSNLFPVSHHHRPSCQIELDQKHIYRSYPTGYRSEIYMNCTANSLMRYSMRPCPSTSSCFKGPYQRYSIGFIF